MAHAMNILKFLRAPRHPSEDTKVAPDIRTYGWRPMQQTLLLRSYNRRLAFDSFCTTHEIHRFGVLILSLDLSVVLETEKKSLIVHSTVSHNGRHPERST